MSTNNACPLSSTGYWPWADLIKMSLMDCRRRTSVALHLSKRLRVTVEWLWRSSIGVLSKVAIATRRNAQEPHECASHRIDAAETRCEGHMLKPVISAF